MIDTSNIKKETSKHEEYAIQWFNDNGFTGKVLHQWVNETAFEVEKDGVTDSFRLTHTPCRIPGSVISLRIWSSSARALS